MSGRHTYPIKQVYPTVIYVDRGHIRYRSSRDERWIPRSVGVTAVLVRGLRVPFQYSKEVLIIIGRPTVWTPYVRHYGTI